MMKNGGEDKADLRLSIPTRKERKGNGQFEVICRIRPMEDQENRLGKNFNI